MSTAFPNRAESIADIVSRAELDIESLCQPIQPCQLATCRGTCCHDGVYLSGEEAETIRTITTDLADDFTDMGLDLPERVVVYGRFRDIASGPKTATRPAPMHDMVADYPSHFADTNCVFLLPDARCALQAIAMDRGMSAWHYKPFTCWIHPLHFERGQNGQPVLTLPSAETDPHTFPDYPGFSSQTHCGRICSEGGKPAYQVLEAELRQLGELGSRDLLWEIEQALAAK